MDYPVHLREFIFIDDHSEDKIVDTLKKLNNIQGLVIHKLPDEKKGKKAIAVSLPSSNMGQNDINCIMSATILEWVNTAAFGSPVVPPV